MSHHKALDAWVNEVATLCTPDQVVWCDGSDGEYQNMLRLMLIEAAPSTSA